MGSVVRGLVDFIAGRLVVTFLAVIAAADPVVVVVGVVLALGLQVENIHQIEVDVAGVMDHALLLWIVNVHEHFEVAERRKLNCFLEQAFLSLAVGDLRS